jgi:hypothetical protein
VRACVRGCRCTQAIRPSALVRRSAFVHVQACLCGRGHVISLSCTHSCASFSRIPSAQACTDATPGVRVCELKFARVRACAAV